MELWCFSARYNFKLRVWAGTAAALSLEMFESIRKGGIQRILMLKSWHLSFWVAFHRQNRRKNEPLFYKKGGGGSRKEDVTYWSLLLLQARYHMVPFTKLMVSWQKCSDTSLAANHILRTSSTSASTSGLYVRLQLGLWNEKKKVLLWHFLQNKFK